MGHTIERDRYNDLIGELANLRSLAKEIAKEWHKMKWPTSYSWTVDDDVRFYGNMFKTKIWHQGHSYDMTLDANLLSDPNWKETLKEAYQELLNFGVSLDENRVH